MALTYNTVMDHDFVSLHDLQVAYANLTRYHSKDSPKVQRFVALYIAGLPESQKSAIHLVYTIPNNAWSLHIRVVKGMYRADVYSTEGTVFYCDMLQLQRHFRQRNPAPISTVFVPTKPRLGLQSQVPETHVGMVKGFEKVKKAFKEFINVDDKTQMDFACFGKVHPNVDVGAHIFRREMAAHIIKWRYQSARANPHTSIGRARLLKEYEDLQESS